MKLRWLSEILLLVFYLLHPFISVNKTFYLNITRAFALHKDADCFFILIRQNSIIVSAEVDSFWKIIQCLLSTSCKLNVSCRIRKAISFLTWLEIHRIKYLECPEFVHAGWKHVNVGAHSRTSWEHRMSADHRRAGEQASRQAATATCNSIKRPRRCCWQTRHFNFLPCRSNSLVYNIIVYVLILHFCSVCMCFLSSTFSIN